MPRRVAQAHLLVSSRGFSQLSVRRVREHDQQVAASAVRLADNLHCWPARELALRVICMGALLQAQCAEAPALGYLRRNLKQKPACARTTAGLERQLPSGPTILHLYYIMLPVTQPCHTLTKIR